MLLSNATMLQSHGLDMADQPVQVTQPNQAMEKLNWRVVSQPCQGGPESTNQVPVKPLRNLVRRSNLDKQNN